MQWLKDRLSKAKGWIIEQWDAFIRVQRARRLPTTACACKICKDLFSTGHQPDAQAERDPQSNVIKEKRNLWTSLLLSSAK
jgi:hypothetical protein